MSFLPQNPDENEFSFGDRLCQIIGAVILLVLYYLI